jgi:hypothetical protein
MKGITSHQLYWDGTEGAGEGVLGGSRYAT